MDKPHLLIVEDDLDLSEMLTTYFRVQNYEVHTASWGEKALKIAEESDIDLAVLDIRLPDIDGYELCRRLREQRKTQDLPIIFLTEKRDRIDKLQGLELGVIDYITKPFDIQELRLRIRNALSRVTRPSTVNAVTELPEGKLVDDKLADLLKKEGKWSVLQLTIGNLNNFRERYGFVAADDVMRAVTLMVRNAVREYGADDDFIGHLTPDVFLIITTTDQADSIRERVDKRINHSREYFYPVKDRGADDEAIEESNRLRLKSAVVKSEAGPFKDLDALHGKLKEVLAPETGQSSKPE